MIDHAVVMNTCCEKLDKLGLTGVSATERTIALSAIANFEIEMGGTSAFFHNSAGRLATETAEAFVALGAMREAAALRTGHHVLKSKSWKQAVDGGEFEKLDEVFRSESRDIFSRVCDFIDLNSSELENLGR